MPNGKARQTPPRRAHGVRPPSGGATTGSPPREGVTRRHASLWPFCRSTGYVYPILKFFRNSTLIESMQYEICYTMVISKH